MNLKKQLLTVALITICSSSQALPLMPAPNVPAKSFKMIDISTDTVLAEKDSAKTTEIASLTKVMTAYVTFNELKNGTLNLDDEVLISKKAWRTDGSKMFIEAGKKVRVEDLVKGMIIVSGNDASVALAEHIAGSEERFVELMNNYAKAIGMTDTVFANATGLPTRAEQHSTARDLATLATRVFKDFPEYTHYFKEKEYTFNDITQPNRNKLLNESDSYSGMKTGYTARSGYSLMSSFHEDGREIITIVLNSDSVTDRFMAAKTLTNYGYRRFANVKPIEEGTPITKIPVLYGKADSIYVYAEKDLSSTIPIGINPITEDIHLVGKLEKNGDIDPVLFAPVDKNYVVGKLTAYYKGEELGSVNLITKENVEEANPFKKIKDWVKLKIGQ
ncbi:TPA: D-alanyl-D-alanine carboxypeptidase family protein [Vibrio parahaemolyticus]